MVDSWSSSITHVVCHTNENREARRTLKYMQVGSTGVVHPGGQYRCSTCRGAVQGWYIQGEEMSSTCTHVAGMYCQDDIGVVSCKGQYKKQYCVKGVQGDLQCCCRRRMA